MKAQRIVIAVDLTDHDAHVVREGLRVAQAFGAEVLVVHVVHELEAMYGIYLGGGSVGQLQAEIDAQGRSRLHALHQELLAAADITSGEVMLKGVPWNEIVACARRSEALMIVIGAHVQKKPEHKVLGSTAERTLRHAPGPVLVVPPAPRN